MIFRNHERQPFLGSAVEKLVICVQKQRTNAEGQDLPLKSALYF